MSYRTVEWGVSSREGEVPVVDSVVVDEIGEGLV